MNAETESVAAKAKPQAPSKTLKPLVRSARTRPRSGSAAIAAATTSRRRSSGGATPAASKTMSASPARS